MITLHYHPTEHEWIATFPDDTTMPISADDYYPRRDLLRIAWGFWLERCEQARREYKIAHP